MQKISRLLDALTGEIHHRPIIVLIAVLVLLMHLWMVAFLLQPTDRDKPATPTKIMEVALVTQPTPRPEITPPAPPKPAPPKVVPTKKKAVIPPVKKKVAIPKPVEQLRLKPQKMGAEPIPIPAQPSISKSVEKPSAPVSKPQSAVANEAVANSGNGEAKSKGVNSGVVELGCPKPKYPMRATTRHIEGWVKIEMVIGTSGTVTSASVAGGQPSGIFDDAALDAAKRCKFKPKMTDGIRVQLKTAKTFRFTLIN